jgi:hypothetical protein
MGVEEVVTSLYYIDLGEFISDRVISMVVA